MPGSPTTPGWAGARDDAPGHVAFRDSDHVGTPNYLAFAAQWLAYALPYRRFADTLTSANARLGADVDRYSFTVKDFHLLLFAGLIGAPEIKKYANGGIQVYHCRVLSTFGKLAPSSSSTSTPRIAMMGCGRVIQVSPGEEEA